MSLGQVSEPGSPGAGMVYRRHRLFAGFRLPAIEEAARGAVSARHPGDHDAIRYQGRDYAGVAFLVVGELLLPDLLASLHVERDDMTINRLAKKFAIIDGRSPAHDDAGLTNPRRPALILNRRAPDRLAGGDIERNSPVAVHHVHNAVVDAGLRQLARVVGKARGPDRRQALDVRFVELIQRTVL